MVYMLDITNIIPDVFHINKLSAWNDNGTMYDQYYVLLKDGFRIDLLTKEAVNAFVELAFNGTKINKENFPELYF